MGFLNIKKITRPEDKHELEVVDKPDAVAIVLFDNKYKNILLVNQFRAGSNSNLWELPAGIIENNEKPIDTIIRETREETGYDDITDLIPLGDFYVSPGYSTERIHLFRARLKKDAIKNQLKLDKNEKLTNKWFKIKDIKTNDMKTQYGITKALSIKKQKIGIFGGTFNPISNLHLLTMTRAIEELNLDKIFIEPVNDSYTKESLISSKHRVNMINLAIQDNKKFKLGTYEVNQLLQPNTINTLDYYKERFGWCEIYFICGSDNLIDINNGNWRGYKDIFKKHKVIVLQRNNDNIYQNIILKNDIMLKYKNNIKIIYENVVNNISSTAIRKLVHCNMSIKYLLPNLVEKYIKDNNLYK